MKEQRKLLVKRNEGKTTEQVREMLKENGFSLDRAVTILESPDAYIYIQDMEAIKAAPTLGSAPTNPDVPPAVGTAKPNVVEELKKAFGRMPSDALRNLGQSTQLALIDVAIDLLRAKILKLGMESLTPVELLIAKVLAAWLKATEESDGKK